MFCIAFPDVYKKAYNGAYYLSTKNSFASESPYPITQCNRVKSDFFKTENFLLKIDFQKIWLTVQAEHNVLLL